MIFAMIGAMPFTTACRKPYPVEPLKVSAVAETPLSDAAYVIRATFHAPAASTRGDIVLVVDGRRRLFAEISKAGMSLLQISYNGLKLSYRNNDDGVLHTSESSKIPYFKGSFPIEVDARKLIKAVLDNQDLVENNLQIRFQYPPESTPEQRRDTTFKPSLIEIGRAGQVDLALRIKSWQSRALPDAKFYELSR